MAHGEQIILICSPFACANDPGQAVQNEMAARVFALNASGLEGGAQGDFPGIAPG